ncbi:MAG TPA: hypothetical protein VI895_00755 [Bdellovibrionota bacterium]|nr:hypothetical protein [Bdellovibrionota bacterium]
MSGCRKTLNPQFLPKSGEIDVPLNAVGFVSFTGDSAIRDSDINTDNFRFTECADQNGSGGDSQNSSSSSDSSNDSSGSQSGDSKEKTKTQSTAGSATPGRLWWRTLPSDEPSSNGTQKGVVTEVYFIPYGPPGSRSPLKEGTDYCFEVAGTVKDEGGNEALTGSTTFTTESSSSFSFAAPGKPVQAELIVREDPIWPQDMVVLHFTKALNPNEVLEGTYACRTREDIPRDEFDNGKDNGTEEPDKTPPQAKTRKGGKSVSRTVSSADEECSSGFRSPANVVLLENLDEKDGVVLADFNTYAVGGLFAGDQNADIEYRIEVDIGSSRKDSSGKARVSIMGPDTGPASFRIRDDGIVKSADDVRKDVIASVSESESKIRQGYAAFIELGRTH